MSHLFLCSTGPVQDFIASARAEMGLNHSFCPHKTIVLHWRP